MQHYQKRISGTLMDRMALYTRLSNAIRLEVQCVPFEKLSSLDGDEPSSPTRKCVEAARGLQTKRFAPMGKPHVLVIRTNQYALGSSGEGRPVIRGPLLEGI